MESSALVCSQLPLRRETTKPNTEFQDVAPATVVVIELQSRGKNATPMIKDAGELYFAPTAPRPLMAAIIPTKKIGKLQRLAGIKRINESRFYTAVPRSQRLTFAEKSQHIITSTIHRCFSL